MISFSTTISASITFLIGRYAISQKIPDKIKDNRINLKNAININNKKAILENKGTLDKYIGDAQMAFWNAPIQHPLHAICACDAAIRYAN